MQALLKLPEYPLIHFSKRNDVVEQLIEIIQVYEHNTKVYKDENERLKGIIAKLQNAPKKPESFDRALGRFFLNKQDLLRSLENPEIPLHNNLSDNDLREYVVRRKLSGGTRSDLGRRCRDVFCSLIKTCMKLRVNVWSFLEARIKKEPSSILSDSIKHYFTNPPHRRSAIASA